MRPRPERIDRSVHKRWPRLELLPCRRNSELENIVLKNVVSWIGIEIMRITENFFEANEEISIITVRAVLYSEHVVKIKIKRFRVVRGTTNYNTNDQSRKDVPDQNGSWCNTAY
jgi:hypothetical protein